MQRNRAWHFPALAQVIHLFRMVPPMSIIIILSLAALAALGLAGWIWIAIATASEDMRSFGGFEGMHFDD